MSIASRITAMQEHLTDDYSVLTLAGADLTNVDKNIINLKPTWKERLLYFMNNGTQQVWNNWEKVNGTGETLTLNNTEEAPMSLVYKGNTYQDSTTGKNLLNLNDFVAISSATTITILDTGIDIKNVGGGYGANITIENLTANTDYYLSYNWKNISNGLNRTVVFAGTGTSTTLATFYNLNGGTFNTGNNTTINIWFYANIPGEAEVQYTDIQLEKGTTKTSWEKYTNGASPNPDYPQDIHVVSGDNSIVVSNEDNTQSTSYPISLGVENLLNNTLTSQTLNGVQFNVNEDKSIYVNGTATARTEPKLWTQASGTMKLKANKTYYNNSNTTLYLYDGAYQVIADGSSYTPTEDKNVQQVYIRVENGETINKTIYPMLSTTKTNTYTPYGTTPIELCKIGDYQDSFIRNNGKNLFDKDSVENDKRLDASGQLISNNATGFSTTGYIKVKPNTKYTYSRNITSSSYYVNICEYTSDKTHIQRLYSAGDTTTKYVFTTPSNCEYLRINDATTNLGTIQLEEGDITTPVYEPYGTNEWYLKKEIGKVVLNGSESWTKSSNTNVNRYYIPGTFINTILNVNTIDLISDYFTCITPTQSDAYNVGLSKLNNTSIMANFSLSDTSFDTLQKFKTWLSTHNTTVYYVLATPTYTEITDSTLINQLETIKKSYEGQTNITQENNDMPFILDITALSKE